MHYVILTRKPNEFINPRPEVITAEATNETPQNIIEDLRKQGKEQVMIAGGASVYRQFLAADLVDTLFITVEPVLFGEGVGLFDQALSGDNETKQLKLKEIHSLSDQTIVLEYSTHA